MESNSTAFLIKIKLRHSLGRPSRSDFVQSEFVKEDKLMIKKIAIVPYVTNGRNSQVGHDEYESGNIDRVVKYIEEN